MLELEKTPLETDNSHALRESELGNQKVFSDSSNEGLHEGVNEKSLLRKLDLKLLPPLSLLYLLSFLDRSNVANARIEGLVTDLHITGNQYLTALTLYFIGYVIFEASDVRNLHKSVFLIFSPGSLQYRSQKMDSSAMASNPDFGLGNRFNSHGSNAEPFWILRCSLLPWYVSMLISEG